jgi:hypothetical protein
MFCLQCAQFTLASLRIVTTAIFTKFANMSYLSQNENINSVKQKICWSKHFIRYKNFIGYLVTEREIISVLI